MPRAACDPCCLHITMPAAHEFQLITLPCPRYPPMVLSPPHLKGSEAGWGSDYRSGWLLLVAPGMHEAAHVAACCAMACVAAGRLHRAVSVPSLARPCTGKTLHWQDLALARPCTGKTLPRNRPGDRSTHVQNVVLGPLPVLSSTRSAPSSFDLQRANAIRRPAGQAKESSG